MLIALWGSPEEFAEPFVAGCRVSLSSALCFLSDFCNTLCGQKERVEFIKILKGKEGHYLILHLRECHKLF